MHSETVAAPSAPNPEVGMLGIVRKRRGLITEVRSYSAQEEGVLHLVRVEYQDDGYPASEELLWELEPHRRLLEASEFPNVSSQAMQPDEFDAMVCAARWTSLSSYIDPDGSGPLDRMPVTAPFHGSIEVDDYQLVPLLKAMQMPRVNLMIADDVGLGKTVEAGLVLSELLIRRRINRVLILTPASLRLQWRDELWSKFSLPFDVVDREHTLNLKRNLGLDANPWRYASRAIASYHYLKQPDILEQFVSACRTPEGSAQLPWDLLIVDEVHNLMPSPFGEDSQLCKTLRFVAPHFEHRLFLTATPHNGHTRAFSGLLELLDPVRFSRTDELRPAERERIKQVVIRRLKREVNAKTNPPRFCNRLTPQALLLEFSPEEKSLQSAFESLRDQVRELIATGTRKKRLAGTFAIEILGKRMLSGPITFLESWRRCKMGLELDDAAGDDELRAAGHAAGEDTDDDREAEQKNATAASVIGAWLKPMAKDLQEAIAEIDAAAKGIGVKMSDSIVSQDPKFDARFAKLDCFIREQLLDGKQWRDDERLVVFTEYKTTLDYLLRRLRNQYPKDESRFLCLYGGMTDVERETIKEAFNDPGNPVRILIATDAASEGLNLQSTARYLLHYDCPWNPSRLEQRNGRLDRHGQMRDVQIFHFASEHYADLKFLAYLIHKVNQIREDLGATGELFDEATHRCLVLGEDPNAITGQLDKNLTTATQSVKLEADNTVLTGNGEAALLDSINALADELNLNPKTGHATLEVAMAADHGHPQLTPPDDSGRFSLVNPNVPGWKSTIDETIRSRVGTGILGPIPKLCFTTKPFLVTQGERTVFRPRTDTTMLHLAHPMMQKATGRLTRHRFPGPNEVSRWAVRLGEVPSGFDALLLVHLEELAVNQLRETFHHWIHTFQIPVQGDEIGKILPHQPAARIAGSAPCLNNALVKQAQGLLSDLEPDLKAFIREHRKQLGKALRDQLELDREQAIQEEEQRYQSRQGEVSSLIVENTLGRLEREIEALKRLRNQGMLFDQEAYLDDIDRKVELKQEELQRRKTHYEEVRQQLAIDRERVIKRLLPKRFTMQGEAQVFAVGVEIRLPNSGAKA